MEVWVLLGETYDGEHDFGTCRQWIAGVYPDELAAQAAKAEIAPLANGVDEATQRVRYESGPGPWPTRLELLLHEAHAALLAVDPRAQILVGTIATSYRYWVLPGTWRQHF